MKLRIALLAFLFCTISMEGFAQLNVVEDSSVTGVTDYYIDADGNAVYFDDDETFDQEVIYDPDEPVDEAYYEEDNYEETEYEADAYEDVYIQRNVEEEKWRKYKKDKRFKYIIKPKKKEKEKEKKEPWNPDLSFFNGAFFKVFLYLVVASLLIYIVFLFFKNNEFSFKRKAKEIKNEEAPWEEVERFEDWELALQKAESDNDYRLATRILYLQTLQKMSKHSIIAYSEERTNWQYVQSLFGTGYHDPFKKLTTYFDYIWYGKYDVEEVRYQELKTNFLTFHNTINL